MDFVNADGRAERIATAALLEPLGIGPFEFLVVPNDGGVFWRDFVEGTVRISFDGEMALESFNFVFIESALAEAGDENFPDAGRAENAHGVEAAVPVIEIANDTDALGVGRPNGETDTGDTVQSAEMSAEFIVDAEFVALGEEVDIHFAEGWEEGKGVAELAGVIAGIRDAEIVGENVFGIFACSFEDAFGVNFLERDFGF